MRRLILLALLAGCTSTVVPVLEEMPTYHPNLPSPYVVCSADWEVVERDRQPLVTVSYDDSLNIASCRKDMERYLNQLLNTTCYYRQELKEATCDRQKQK